MTHSRSLLAMLLTCLAPMPARASVPPEWTRPVVPFHIVGPVWYVGTEGLAAYAIRTTWGAILIDGTLAENADLVKRNLAAIGISPRSVRYILVTHAHFDHVGADAALKAATGAALISGAGDKSSLETGRGPGEYASGKPVSSFPPVMVDRAVGNGEQVMLGGAKLIAHITPGHTPGCTTWTMRVVDHGDVHNIAFLCSLTVAGNRLVDNASYPHIIDDYRMSFKRLAGATADIVLPAHPDVADVLERGKRAAAGDSEAFVSPGLLSQLVTEAQTDFDEELARQRAAANDPR